MASNELLHQLADTVIVVSIPKDTLFLMSHVETLRYEDGMSVARGWIYRENGERCCFWYYCLPGGLENPSNEMYENCVAEARVRVKQHFAEETG